MKHIHKHWTSTVGPTPAQQCLLSHSAGSGVGLWFCLCFRGLDPSHRKVIDLILCVFADAGSVSRLLIFYIFQICVYSVTLKIRFYWKSVTWTNDSLCYFSTQPQCFTAGNVLNPGQIPYIKFGADHHVVGQNTRWRCGEVTSCLCGPTLGPLTEL